MYLAISAHPDVNFNDKLASLFNASLAQLKEAYPNDGFEEIEEIVTYLLKYNVTYKSWKLPHDYHVTVLYIGGDLTKTHTEIYKNFIED